MNYLLTMLTNGRRDCFKRTLTTFLEFAIPQPASIFVMDDAAATGADGVLRELLADVEIPWMVEASPAGVMLGQCRAQAHCWFSAAHSDHEYVVHLEDDLLLLRPIDLRELAGTIDSTEAVQMALVRCPWGAEIEYGGYIPMMPGLYERRQTWVNNWGRSREMEWIATTRNWAHAPALYRTDLCREFPFPAQQGCETTLGPMILDRYPDAVFGLWGWGEPWCAHVGVERAPESHGY